MADEITPIATPVWDRRVISRVRRDLEKAFNSMTQAFDKAHKDETEEAQVELNKRANFFYDLYEARMSEYEKCKLEDGTQTEEVADQLTTDFARYKAVLNKHFKRAKAAVEVKT